MENVFQCIHTLHCVRPTKLRVEAAGEPLMFNSALAHRTYVRMYFSAF